MNKNNKKYYILLLFAVIISLAVPMCTYATDAEWESSVAAEQSKFQSSALVEQSKSQSEWDSSVAQKNAERSSSVAQKNAEWSSSVAAEASKSQSERDSSVAQKNAEWSSSVAQKNSEWSSSIAQAKEESRKEEEKMENIWDFLFVPAIVLVVILNIIFLVKALKGNKSAKTTFVPFQGVTSDNEKHTPQNTLQKIEGKCMYCGKDISSDSEFCSHCGKKQVQEYVKIFNRYNMNNDEFIATINSWLANNPKIANVKCEFNMRTGYGFLVNKYLLDSVALKYELFKNNNENQYAIVELKKFGLYQKSSDALLEEWKSNNPNAVVLKHSGGRHSRGDKGHELFLGIGANNNTQLFVFFKFKRNQ